MQQKDKTSPESEEQKVGASQLETSEEGQDVAPASEAPEETASGADKVDSTPAKEKQATEGQADSAAGTEKNSQSGMKDGVPFDYQKGYNELLPQYTKATQALKPLQEFYTENAPLVAALERHPEILDQLIAAERNVQLTPDSVREMVNKEYEERKASEATQAMIDSFRDSHPEFKDPAFAKRFLDYFEETDAKITPKTLQYAYDFLTSDKKIAAAKEEAVAQKGKEDTERKLARVGSESAAGGSATERKLPWGGNTLFPNPNRFLEQPA